jgi:hypothetical protein
MARADSPSSGTDQVSELLMGAWLRPSHGLGAEALIRPKPVSGGVSRRFSRLPGIPET